MVFTLKRPVSARCRIPFKLSKTWTSPPEIELFPTILHSDRLFVTKLTARRSREGNTNVCKKTFYIFSFSSLFDKRYGYLKWGNCACLRCSWREERKRKMKERKGLVSHSPKGCAIWGPDLRAKAGVDNISEIARRPWIKFKDFERTESSFVPYTWFEFCNSDKPRGHICKCEATTVTLCHVNSGTR